MPLVVILVGCKKNAGECKTETDELVKLLRGADKPPSVPYGLGIELKADGLFHGDQRLELDNIGPSLVERQKYVAMRDRREYGEGTGVSVVRVEDNVPWSRVVELAAALSAAHYDHPIFLVPHAPHSTPPPRTPTDDEIDKAFASKPGEQATTIAKIASKIVEPCKPLKKVFGTVGGDEGADKGEVILLGMSEALPECSCDVDMGALRSVMYRVYEDPYPADPRKLTLVKSGKPVALPAATPWKDAAKQLPEGETVWLIAN